MSTLVKQSPSMETDRLLDSLGSAVPPQSGDRLVCLLLAWQHEVDSWPTPIQWVAA
jgi:hypothetical protein